MDLMGTIAIVMLVAMIPLALFVGIIALALLIWCWARVGRYFINLARWIGHWQNFVPMTILGTIYVLILVVLWQFLLPQLGIVWIVLLLLQVVITIVCFIFAAIAWVFWFHEWFWPKYRRWLWGVIFHLFQQPQTRARRVRPPGPGTGRPTEPPHGTQPAVRQPLPQKRSMLSSFWDVMLGKPQPRRRPARPAGAQTTEQTLGPSGAMAATPAAESGIPRVPSRARPDSKQKPVKRSWFSTFWALMLGKPQPKRRPARPTGVQTTEQSLGPSGAMGATPVAESGSPERVASKARPDSRQKPVKRSWFSTFWALMLGKPSKPVARKIQPEETKARDRSDRVGRTASVEAKTGAATQVTKPPTGEKPAKRGFFAGTWNSFVRGVTFVVGLIILGVLWVVQKVREGIEWIRVRFNLD